MFAKPSCSCSCGQRGRRFRLTCRNSVYFINFQSTAVPRGVAPLRFQHRTGAELSTSHASPDCQGRTVTTAVVRGVRRDVGGRTILVSRSLPPSCGVLGSWSLQISCSVCERGSTTCKEERTCGKEGAQTAGPTTATTCLDQFTSSPNEGQDKFLRHHSHYVSVERKVQQRKKRDTVHGRSNTCLSDLPSASSVSHVISEPRLVHGLSSDQPTSVSGNVVELCRSQADLTTSCAVLDFREGQRFGCLS